MFTASKKSLQSFETWKFPSYKRSCLNEALFAVFLQWRLNLHREALNHRHIYSYYILMRSIVWRRVLLLHVEAVEWHCPQLVRVGHSSGECEAANDSHSEAHVWGTNGLFYLFIIFIVCVFHGEENAHARISGERWPFVSECRSPALARCFSGHRRRIKPGKLHQGNKMAIKWQQQCINPSPGSAEGTVKSSGWSRKWFLGLSVQWLQRPFSLPGGSEELGSAAILLPTGRGLY